MQNLLFHHQCMHGKHTKEVNLTKIPPSFSVHMQNNLSNHRLRCNPTSAATVSHRNDHFIFDSSVHSAVYAPATLVQPSLYRNLESFHGTFNQTCASWSHQVKSAGECGALSESNLSYDKISTMFERMLTAVKVFVVFTALE